MDIFSPRQRLPRFNPRTTTLRQSKLYNEATGDSGLSLAYLGHGQPLTG